MFLQQFYFDFNYTDGLTGLLPRTQFENMYLLIRGQPQGFIPTQEETQQIFDELAEEFTPENIKEIIKKLHQELIIQMQGKRRIKELGEYCDIMATHAELRNPPLPPTSNINSQIQRVIDNIEIAEELTLEETQIEYSSGSVLPDGDLSPEQQKWQQRRMAIAAALVQKGYGLHYFIEEQRNRGIRDVINRSKYNMLARGVATDVFRSIERYLQDRIQITTTPKEHISLAIDLLLRCRLIMLPDDCLTFRRAVKKAFNIPSPTVTQQEVARVYVAVQYEIKRQLERRSIKQNYAISFSLSNPQQIVPQMVQKSRKRIHRRDKKAKRQMHKGLERVWCEDVQQEFLKLFKQNSDFNFIMAGMKATFPEHKRFVTPNQLRRQLNRLIRFALRRLKNLLVELKEEGPEMVSMTDRRTKYLTLVGANEVVKELMKFHTQNFDKEQLQRTVTAINDYVAKKDHEIAMRKKDQPKNEHYEEQDYSDLSSDEPEEEFKRVRAALGDHNFKSISTRSRAAEPKFEKTTEDTWMQRPEHELEFFE